MKPRHLLFACVMAQVVAAQADDQPALTLDNQVVEGQLYNNPIAADAYAVEVLTRAELQRMPVATIADALEWVAGLDLRQRGSGGTQVDLGIRGASYEQTLVLIDGVRMNDPQTGHHNFDLPLVLEDIERIEVVRGPGAGQYGPNGNGGVINLVTRKQVNTESGREALLQLEAGSKDYDRAVIALGKTDGRWSTFASAAQQTSDSYIRQADLGYTLQQGNARLVYQGERSNTVIGAGYIDKGFGADGFYGPMHHHQREDTIQRHLYLNQGFKFGGDALDLSANWRRHDDEFLYVWNTTPLFSEHQSEALQTRLRYHFSDVATIGLENNKERIDSTSLLTNVDPEQQRSYQSAFMSGQWPAGSLTLSGSLSYIDYTDDQNYTLPVIGLSYRHGMAEFYANSGKSARVPTVFDLYLKQGSNRGNPDLKAEQTRSSEVGVRLNWSGVQTQLAVFQRRSDNVIDFTVTQQELDDAQANNSSLIYTARNISEVSTQGIDVMIDASDVLSEYGLSQASFSYANLEQDFKNQYARGKYAITQFDHQAILKLAYEWRNGLAVTSMYKYEDRISAKSYQLWDLGLRQQLAGWHWSLAATNVLNERYYDSSEYLRAPGNGYRLSVGVRL